jgi:DNA polymerase IV
MSTNYLPYNQAPSRVMHIDLNSCFAIIEQQANRLLRGKPVGVAAYDTPRGFVLAASYEAKRMGIKLGVNVREARAMCPGIIIMTPDPAKYREAHRRFKELMLEYTSDVVPKSIDEFVLDLSGSPALRSGKTMEEIGNEIKTKIHERLGEAVTVNIGIGPNRFLAKYAAGFGKPDGMREINHTNLEDAYRNMDLVDLPGINVRYRRRLKMYSINAPLDFLHADQRLLQKVIFQSIHGRHWYLRLRGYEVDRYESKRSSIGHQYALPHQTWDRDKLARLLLKLCEKVGRRLRSSGVSAGGIHLYLSFINYQDAGLKDKSWPSRSNGAGDLSVSSGVSRTNSTAHEQRSGKSPDTSRYIDSANGQVDATDRSSGFLGGENLASKRAWHHGEKVGYRLYSTASVYQAAKNLLDKAELYNKVRGMAITTFNLEPVDPEQLNLFEVGEAGSTNHEAWVKDIKMLGAERRLSDALDTLNNRYGEFVVTPANMMDMRGTILDRIAFGSVRDL